jgi:hypothetical protein
VLHVNLALPINAHGALRERKVAPFKNRIKQNQVMEYQLIELYHISAQPGLILQMAGFLTSKRIWGCTTFVDHVSDYIYVHLMKDFTIMETLLAKLAFEKLCAKPTVLLNIFKLIMVHFLSINSLPPAIFSTKSLSFAELVHTIKIELSKTEINS